MSSADSVPEPLSGKFKGSFAYVTIRDRLPVILTKVIDCLHRERHAIAKAYGTNAGDEAKAIIGRLSELRNEMVTNKLIIPLKSNAPDVPVWDAYLEQQHQLYGFEPAWFDSPWLYSECYLYRRIREAFELSSLLRDYDPFQFEKKASLHSALKETVALASILDISLGKINGEDDNKSLYEEFKKFIEISLWGNRCDLSISAGSNAVQSSAALLELNSLRPYIISNETEELWTILHGAVTKYGNAVRVDIVLDNAGFELYTDLCLLEFLDSSNLMSEAHLYVKMMPWFVSDTLVSDIDFLLNTLDEQEDSRLVSYSKKWRQNFETGKWVIEREMFWTLPHDYSEMRSVDKDLYNKLSKSNLVIFKGDLNYRKLTSDRKWEATTPFVTSLRGFLPAPLCTLRTVKADLISGLKPGIKETLDKTSSTWMFTGKYAVIQCATDDR